MSERRRVGHTGPIEFCIFDSSGGSMFPGAFFFLFSGGAHVGIAGIAGALL